MEKRIKEIIRMPHGMGALAVTAMKFLYNLRRDGIEAGKGRSLQEDRMKCRKKTNFFYCYYFLYSSMEENVRLKRPRIVVK